MRLILKGDKDLKVLIKVKEGRQGVVPFWWIFILSCTDTNMPMLVHHDTTHGHVINYKKNKIVLTHQCVVSDRTPIQSKSFPWFLLTVLTTSPIKAALIKIVREDFWFCEFELGIYRFFVFPRMREERKWAWCIFVSGFISIK